VLPSGVLVIYLFIHFLDSFQVVKLLCSPSFESTLFSSTKHLSLFGIMRHFAALLLSACLAGQAAAQFTFKVEATFKGKPIPQSEIKLERIDTKKNAPSTVKLLPEKNKAEADPIVRKRANPTASSANWCGSVNHATNANQIKLIHTYFQHPTCTKRTGVTQYPQAVAAWAGIDGDTWASALLQSGTVCKIDNSTGIVRNEAWWQWLPNGAYTISSLPG
jgi:hypothetical protein